MAVRESAQQLEVTSFIGGLNTRKDPRVIDQNESPAMINVDVLGEGAVQTRYGYEKVCDLPSGTSVLGISPYYKEPVAGAVEVTTLLVTHAATASGNITVTIDGVPQLVAVLNGDTVNQVATKIQTAVNGSTYNNVLYSASVNTATVTITPTVRGVRTHTTFTDTGLTGVTASPSFVAGTADVAGFNYLLIWGDNGNLYYITDSSNTPTLIGAWAGVTGEIPMTTTAPVRAAQLNNKVIFGNGTGEPLIYDGLTIHHISDYPLHKSNSIFEYWYSQGSASSMFAAGDVFSGTAVDQNSKTQNIGGSTLYYSDNTNPESWSFSGSSNAGLMNVYAGDGDKITAIKSIDEQLAVFKQNHTFLLKYYPDSTAQLKIGLSPYKMAAGCVAPGSAQRSFNDLIRLADPDTYGVCALGLQQSVFSQNQRNNSLSWKIQPTVRGINKSAMQNAVAKWYQDKYWLCVPMGTSPQNDTMLVYSLTSEGVGYWTTYNNIPASCMDIFRTSDQVSHLYWGSNQSPSVYRMNTGYADDNGNYRRYFRTKTFDLGHRVHSKALITIYCRGAISANTTLTLRAVVDGVTSQNYTITSAHFEQPVQGGIMGDNVQGDSIFGGTDSQVLQRFMYRNQFDNVLSNGREVYFEFENNGAGQPWKIDYLGITFAVQGIDDNFPMALTA